MMVFFNDDIPETTTTSSSSSSSSSSSPTYHRGGGICSSGTGKRKSTESATASRSTMSSTVTSMKNLIPILCGLFYICHYSIWVVFEEGSGGGSTSIISSSSSCFHLFPHLPPSSGAPTSTTSSTTTATNDNTTTTTTTTTKSKLLLGDDCYHVFIDVGSNIGVHGRFLLEPYMYKKSRFAVRFFQQQFSNDVVEVYYSDDSEGGSDTTNSTTTTTTTTASKQYSLEDVRNNVCVIAIEPNPQHTHRQLEIQDSYRQMGWKYTYLGVGVSTTNAGNVTFQKRNDDKSPGSLGFTSMLSPENKENVLENMVIESSVEVPTIRLASWLQEEILGRAIPKYNFTKKDPPAAYDRTVNDMLNQKQSTSATTTSTNNTSTTTTRTTITVNPIPPKVIMKLDVEGMEYLLMPDLISSGSLCQIVDVIFGEFHFKDKFLWRLSNNPFW